VVTAAASLFPLTACTPADLPVLAARSVDGQPVLLIASCAKLDAKRIAVSADEEPSLVWWVKREDGDVPPEATLLEVPDGWQETERSLTEFVPGKNYGVSVYGDRKATPIRFTLERLAELKPGQVLVGDPPSKGKVVSEDKFRAKAKKACD